MSPLPFFLVGAAGAYAIASVFAPGRATAAPAETPTPSRPPAPSPSLGFDFGRPVPASTLAGVSSGWARPRADRLHRALDIPLPVGTPILAVDRGVVVRAERSARGDAGRWVAIQHPSGVTSRYLHLSRVRVTRGQEVMRGDTIGLSGDTGNSAVPHLHLDLRVPAAMLPAIERAIGRPRTGWGPELSPFGHSIPGEPWIPVDDHRADVRREAAAAGIPLWRSPTLRNAGLVYRPVGRRGEPYPDWLRKLKGSSGIYVIRERRADGEMVTVYVGQSSGGRLYETLTRHLQTVRHEAREVPMT